MLIKVLSTIAWIIKYCGNIIPLCVSTKHTLVILSVYLKGIYPFVVNCDIIVVVTSWIRKSGRQITGGFNSDLFTLSMNLDLYIHGCEINVLPFL